MNTKKSSLLLYLVITLGFVMGYLYNSQSDPTAAVMPVPVKYQMASMKGLDNLSVDYSVLSAPQFKELKVFGQNPVAPVGGGKSDPFQ